MEDHLLRIAVQTLPGVEDVWSGLVDDALGHAAIGMPQPLDIYQLDDSEELVPSLRLDGRPFDGFIQIRSGYDDRADHNPELVVEFGPHDSSEAGPAFIHTFYVVGERYVVGNVAGPMSLRSLMSFVRSYVEALVEARWPTNLRSEWERSSEVLLTKLGRLLADRERLTAELATALSDAELAHARIRQLEALNDLLLIERYQTKDKVSMKVIARIALTIAAIVNPLLVVVVDHALTPPVQQVHDAAITVIQDCGITVGTDELP